MIKTEKVTKIVDEIVIIQCDCCGEDIKPDHPPFQDINDVDYLTLKGIFGYGSPYDGDQVEAHICTECWINKIKPLMVNNVVTRGW